MDDIFAEMKAEASRQMAVHQSKALSSKSKHSKKEDSVEALMAKAGAKDAVKKKKAKDNAAQAGSTSASKKGNGTRVAKRPAVAARKAKALLAVGKVPPPSALAALKKKQKQKKQAQASKSK